MNLKEEKKLWKKGYERIVCLDESGRGPLAGPVTAAAVTILPAKIKNQSFDKLRIDPERSRTGQKLKINPSINSGLTLSEVEGVKNLLKEVKDSKKLTPKKRERIYNILVNHPQIEWGIGRVRNKVIDRINILEATKLAMKRAVKKLNKKPDFLILDGNMKINSSVPQKSIVKADEKVFSCAAASILAKVTRDRMMKRYHKKYPQYGFDQHKGYPTKLHRKMLKKYGPCTIHRKSFKPVAKYSRK